VTKRKHGTSIEWTHGEGFRGETWNPATGCSKVSPGCANCYAETLSLRYGWSKKPWTPENAAENVVLHPERLDQPLRWRKPRMVFVNSMSDLFHEEIEYHFIRDVFNVMRRCDGGIVAATGKPNPAHTFQVLTKRPERALELWRSRKLGFTEWPQHVWLGVSIENARHTWRADVLREIPAAVRFISAEPLLGSLYPSETQRKKNDKPLDLTGISWLIVGGESGHGARSMRPEWARDLRDACLDLRRCPDCADCNSDTGHPAFFFKQWGGRTPKAGGRLLDGREWNEMPKVKR
jgi:protein gp37